MDRDWSGSHGLADDVRHYGAWMRDEAEKRIGDLYPGVTVTPTMARRRPDLKPYVGRELTVTAWLWARTVSSPNPAFGHVEVPLVSTFMLSTKRGKEAYVEPVISAGDYRFEVRVGAPQDRTAARSGTKTSRGANFRCFLSDAPLTPSYIKSEGRAGRMGARLMAVVAAGDRERVYLDPTAKHAEVAGRAQPNWRPELPLPANPRWFSPPDYGFPTFGDLFTPRQLVALTTFSDLVGEAMERIRRDAVAAGLPDDDRPLRDGGTGGRAYAEAVGLYLAFAVDKCADYWSTIATWMPRGTVRQTFARQAIAMAWDYAEAAPLSHSHCSWRVLIEWVAKAINLFPAENRRSSAHQSDGATQRLSNERVVSTDPPYYDNIGYADLSDFFYVWLRRSLRPVFPNLCSTLAVPKTEELVATLVPPRKQIERREFLP